MKKGILTGFAISALLFAGCYYLLGYGAQMCGPGIGFLLSPLILLIAIVISASLLKNKSVIVAYASKTILYITVLLLLVYVSLFFF
jgi:hypothetical protein